MAEQILMPKIAMGQTEGQVSEWLVPEGAWIEKGQPVMVIDTEKVSYEIEAPASGYLVPQVPAGQVVPVGTVVALLAQTEAELSELQGAIQPTPTRAKQAAAQIHGASSESSSEPEPFIPQRIKITPVARRTARQHGIDITRLSGSGPGGRIIKRDVDRAIAAMAEATTPTPQGPILRPAPTAAPEQVAGLRVQATVPFRGMRKAIADHMVHSLAVSAQVSGACELDMTAIVRLRRELLQKEDEIGVRVTYNDIFVFMLSRAVPHVPIVNASLVEDEIRIWEDVNVSIAVAVEKGPYETGLLTPVLRNAERKSLGEIARESRELVEKALAGRLSPQETQGGTITVSNVGMLAPGWTVSTPILNQPQAFILQPGKIGDRPVVQDGELVIRSIMPLSFTFDHRIMDGAAPLQLIARLAEYAQHPEYLLL